VTRRVFLDHDGGVDDFLALLLLCSYEDIDFIGVSVTPADTIIEAAVPATRRILDLAGRSNVRTARGTLEGINPFPFEWRLDAVRVEAMPVLHRVSEVRAPLSPLPGHEFLVETIMAAPPPVTLVMTGPLTNLALALDRTPGIESRIDELVWMGGALDAPGNVIREDHDGSAEWNVFWDPVAAHRVFRSDLPIRMFPLDATNTVPVTPDFIRSLGAQFDCPFSAAAASFWALTADHQLRTGTPYFCWDTLTVSYLARPDLVTYREVSCDVVVGGASQGRTVPLASGRSVTAAATVDVAGFFDHCRETLRR